ncbi:MAG TPA: bifunctional lysylphosphatidylglycerol flippase/synthetase MprF [Thermoanaerobaculia bacterium]|nr:bifunctional lysylphosphatidylglycerol flippase/synthetase MprF [Thermoanaerobaculia bacterium]
MTVQSATPAAFGEGIGVPSKAMPAARRRQVLSILGGIVFLVALRMVFGELRNFHYRQVVAYLDALRASAIALAALFTAASYAALAFYDVAGARFAKHELPLRRVVFASFVSAAVSNTVGLSGVAGGSLRYRLYTSWGVPAREVARLIAFGAATFWLGFLTLGGAMLTLDPLTLPRFAGPLLLAAPIGYLLLIPRRRSILPSPRLALVQLALGAGDWLCASLAFAALLPQGRVTAMHAIAVFLAAQVLGAISNLPAGVGVFEAAVFTLLRGAVPASELAGALVAYRAVYYLLPLVAAGVSLAAAEAVRRRRALSKIGRGVARTVSLFVPAVFSIGAFAAGVVLLVSGATPAEGLRIAWLRTTVPLPLVELAHLVGSMAGGALLLLAPGIQRRLNGAYVLAVSLLGAAIAASLLKGLDYEEATLLAVLLLALTACRREFYRRTALVDEPFTAGWILAIALAVASTVWLGFFAYRRIAYDPALWWHFSFSGDAPRFLRASLGVAVVALAFSIRKLLRAAPPEPRPSTAKDIEAGVAIATAWPAPHGLLVLTRDKLLLWNEARTAYLMYGVQGRSWVALGDPIGPRDEARELAWRFFEEADRHNAWPVFYQVRAELLPLYVELGLHLLKLGEEARVDAQAFSRAGNARKALRHTVQKLECDGVTLELVDGARVHEHLPELRRVSDDWLAAKSTREKRFSVGFFDEQYLSRLPMALVRKGEELVAFANVWGDDAREELTVDLMRHTPAAPQGVMDFLFVRLIEHARVAGYRWFNLGMAPLSGVEARAQGPLWGRVAALGVEHGSHFYNFQGLRQYKSKFGPVWTPVFLASPGGMRVPLILTDIASLISGGVRGILGR